MVIYVIISLEFQNTIHTKKITFGKKKSLQNMVLNLKLQISEKKILA